MRKKTKKNIQSIRKGVTEVPKLKTKNRAGILRLNSPTGYRFDIEGISNKGKNLLKCKV